MEYIGLDVHKQTSTAYVYNDELKEGRHFQLRNIRSDFEALLSICDDPKLVLEAGRSSYMVYDIIEDLVADIQMANPLQVKAIAWSAVKTDKVDAETLCKLLRADFIPPAHIRDRANRLAIYLLRQRMFFVKVCSMFKYRIHALLDRQSETIRLSHPSCRDMFGKTGQNWMNTIELPPDEAIMLAQMQSTIDFLSARISELESHLKAMFKEDKIVQRLKTIPGIGDILSLMIRLEIDDISRFRQSSNLTSYAGLVPSTFGSGGKIRQGKLIKSCNRWLKWAMIEAVYPAIRKNHWLKNKYNHLKSHKPANVAKAAIARQLMLLVYKIWTEERDFTPEKPGYSSRTA